MPSSDLERAPNGNFLLPSVQKNADGTPRFALSLPPGYQSDPGLEILARLETTRAGFEFPTRAFFDGHLQPGDTFIDVGAHFGLYSLGAATLAAGGIKVIAFEPHPFNILTLLRQLALNGQLHGIEVVCAACGAAAGLGKLWPYSTMGNFISDEKPEDAPDDNPPLTVPIVALDMLLDERPDIASTGRIMVKIDVDGYEPAVIAGAERLLASGRVAAIVLEKSDYYAASDRWAAFEAMVQSLRRHGYSLHWFPHVHLPSALIPWVSGNETGNIVALSPGFEERDVYDGPFAPYTALPPPMNENFSAADQADLTCRLIQGRGTDGWRWANPRSMDDDAEERASLAKPYLPEKGGVLDLGAGLMTVLHALRIGVAYTPVDLIRYSKATRLLDLNSGRFPEGHWDCVLTLELLEHIHDVAALLQKTRAASSRLVGTYKAVEETGDTTERRQRGYFNDFDRPAVSAMLEAAGWKVERMDVHGAHTLFVCG